MNRQQPLWRNPREIHRPRGVFFLASLATATDAKATSSNSRDALMTSRRVKTWPVTGIKVLTASDLGGDGP